MVFTVFTEILRQENISLRRSRDNTKTLLIVAEGQRHPRRQCLCSHRLLRVLFHMFARIPKVKAYHGNASRRCRWGHKHCVWPHLVYGGPSFFVAGDNPLGDEDGDEPNERLSVSYVKWIKLCKYVKWS